MRRVTVWSFAVLFLAVWPSSAQRILPSSVGEWTNAGEPMVQREVSPQQILNEYGLASAQCARFERGQDFLDACVYKLKDASGAYGVYSYLHTPDLQKAGFTEHSSISSTHALILVGNLVLDVSGKDLPGRVTELRALVTAVRSEAQESPLPTLPLHLPQKNLVEGTDRYILGPQTLNELFPGGLGDALGFQSGAEAELAHYRLGGRDATLVIADFPTPQIASQKFSELEKSFNVNGANPTGGSATLYASRSSTMLGIVFGASNKSEADTLLDQIDSGTVLTWNEPTFQFKEPSIEMMIEGSIVGAGVICMFALVAGLSFGGVRLLVKRVMPGKVFDRSNHLQVLQLGLGSKAINSDDFYGYSPAPDSGAMVDKNLPDRVAMRIFR